MRVAAADFRCRVGASPSSSTEAQELTVQDVSESSDLAQPVIQYLLHSAQSLFASGLRMFAFAESTFALHLVVLWHAHPPVKLVVCVKLRYKLASHKLHTSLTHLYMWDTLDLEDYTC